MTRNNYCKRGNYGPCCCPLCKRDLETVDTYLYIVFHSTGMDICCFKLDISCSWDQGTSDENLCYCFSFENKQSLLPLFFIWGVWRHWNCLHLKEVPFILYRVSASICGMNFEALGTVGVTIPKIITTPSFHAQSPISFFDGASQMGMCGVGMFLLVNDSRRYSVDGMWSWHQHKSRVVGTMGNFAHCILQRFLITTSGRKFKHNN